MTKEQRDMEQMRKYVSNIIDGEMRDWPFFYQQSYPWHYHFFRRFAFYRKCIGSTWQLFQIEPLERLCWMKMKRTMDGAIITETYP